MTRIERDDVACRLADREDPVTYRWTVFNGLRGQSQRDKVLVSRLKIIDHEVEGRVAPADLVFEHQDQMRPAAHFIHGNPRSIEYRAHSDSAHELLGFAHAVCFQHDMRDTHGRALIVHRDLPISLP